MSECAEMWKDISGYEGLYQVSTYGRVRKSKRKNPVFCKDVSFIYLSKIDNGNGYDYVTLWKNGSRKNHYVHRLVAGAFIKKTDCRNCVNHIDYDRKNNNVNNLEWCTYSENIQHSVVHMCSPRRQKNNTGERYIHKRPNGTFEVTVNRHYIGKYSDIKDAIRERDRYIEKINYY